MPLAPHEFGEPIADFVARVERMAKQNAVPCYSTANGTPMPGTLVQDPATGKYVFVASAAGIVRSKFKEVVARISCED